VVVDTRIFDTELAAQRLAPAVGALMIVNAGESTLIPCVFNEKKLLVPIRYAWLQLMACRRISRQSIFRVFFICDVIYNNISNLTS
jgi:hypothetical protein